MHLHRVAFGEVALEQPQRQPDITRAKELLGWEPTVSLEEGLRRLLAQPGLVAEPV